eukprot:TRINITY_DN6101_c0_g1_i4.p1 TRINITY_DN6101_c0_g1~~TRINITY_DN6101_c0_g1_i4.p1  ORF type:complete len:321 (+),score=72.66 TRINITY_DN6101_c0_g1_i4:67-1029(+)
MAATRPLKTFTVAEVAKHNKDGDTWIVIDGKVYDVSRFAALHPGGRHVLVKESGKDVSEMFKVYHNKDILDKYGPKFLIGTLEGHEENGGFAIPGAFGDLVPYGDPLWYQRFNSPYYKETHHVWREKVRRFVDTEIIPTMDSWRGEDRPPAAILQKMGKEGLLAAMCGPPWPAAYLPADVTPPEDFDYFHELILYDEISRCGSSPVIAALTNGPAIALSVVLRFGSEEMKRRVVPGVLLGQKFIALAISEPQAGSDVAGLVTEAKRVGDHYVVNGNKKWITNGWYADYFSTAVRTGKPGQLSFPPRRQRCKGIGHPQARH